MTVFYYDKEKAEQGILFCLGQEDKVLTQEEIQEQGKSELYKNAVTYTGEGVLIGHPIVEVDTVRKATEKELIDLGLLTLTDGEILEGDTIKKIPQPSWQYKWESPNWVVDRSKLQEGEKIEDNKIVKVEKPKGVKIEWNYDTWIYEEKATEDEVAEFIGNLVTSILYDVLAIGCEVTIKGNKHQQSLEKSKREALDEQIGAINLAKELGETINLIMWPFKDDGTDTVTMSTDEFKQMVLECHKYGQNCYIAAELLKAKRNINSTIDDFYAELKNVDGVSLENL